MRRIALLALIGCGPAQGPAAPAPSVPARASSCPSDVAAAQSSSCSQKAGVCTYGATTCRCERAVRCSGVPPSPDEPPQPFVWTCRTPNPECPEIAPTDGSSCSGTPSCTYGSCGSTTWGCVSGRWTVTKTQAPPPSMPR